MKLSVIIPALNQFPILKQAVKYLIETREQESDYDITILDNGSDEKFEYPGVRVVELGEAIGSYKAFDIGYGETDADILAFVHSDIFIYEKGWCKRVVGEFEKDSRLGMIGFVGSNEIDPSGGRGLGTTSNFMGRTTTAGDMTWTGSSAEVHGKRGTGFTKAAVVDGCVMILRRTALEDIGFRDDFPPHHFYDRLISTQLLEKHWNIGVLGIEFDHISGQTVAHEPKYHEMAKKWIQGHRITPGGIGTNWDNEVYRVAEGMWLKEYRDQKHIVPIKV